MKLVKVGLAAAILATASAGFAAEEHVTIDKVPAAVRATIEKEAAGAPIHEIEVETEDGKSIYEIETEKDGKEVEFSVASDGTLLGYEDESEEADDDEDEDEGDEEEEEEEEAVVALDSIPEAARKSIQAIVGANAIGAVTKETEGGAAVYEVEYKVEGVSHEAEVAASGEVVETERTIDAAELPEAVRKAVEAKYPGAKLRETNAVQLSFYEIEVETEKGVREIKLLATGAKLEDE